VLPTGRKPDPVTVITVPTRPDNGATEEMEGELEPDARDGSTGDDEAHAVAPTSSVSAAI